MKILKISILFVFTSCAINRAPSERMLDVRSDYQNDKALDVSFVPSATKMLPQRSSAVTADIWVHPNEMPTGDYFLGGWIRSVIKEPHWSEDAQPAFHPVTRPDPSPTPKLHHPEKAQGRQNPSSQEPNQ